YGPGDWRLSGVLVASGNETASGLSGDWRLALESASGQMHESADFGVYRLAEVWNDTDHWRQDHSGGVHALNSRFARANAVTAKYLARREYLHPNPRARLEYLGSRKMAELSYTVVRVTPRGGQPVELWFDPGSGLLARSVWQMPIDTLTIDYADYRRIAAASGAAQLVPFKVTRQEGDAEADIVTLAHAQFVAQAAADEFVRPATPDDSSVAGGLVTVPIEYDGDVMVTATLNGHGPLSFILDTGGHDILTPQAAAQLGLHGVGAGASGGAGAGTRTEQYTRVERVQIGGVTLRDQSFFIIPLQYGAVERGGQPPLAGILGVELFERFAMELNYRERTLSFRPLAHAPPGRGVPVPIRFSDDQPIVSAKIDGIEGDNGLDTGNSGSLVVQGRWAHENGLAPRLRRGLQTASFGAGGMSQNWATRVDLEVAGRRFPHVLASYSEDQKGAFSSRTEAGNIGNQIYDNFTLAFDYGRNTVWFAPLPAHAPQPYSRAGMGLYKQSPDSFTVVTVLPNGPAAQAGIENGDEVVGANGTPARALSGWDMRRLARAAPGSKLTLEVKRNGQIRTAELTLREMLP
ncbi:MAG TPA: aspartyl protease family protein, partial [Candidatus Dormibacteraeota bacterium]|nr:aspartyl protease family protein [Candidatus Dormibacteraeota bacterium]